MKVILLCTICIRMIHTSCPIVSAVSGRKLWFICHCLYLASLALRLFAASSITNTLINPLNAELNPICHLLVLLGTQYIFHVSVLRVKYNRIALCIKPCIVTKLKFKLQERKSLKASHVFCCSASMDGVIFEKLIVIE